MAHTLTKVQRELLAAIIDGRGFIGRPNYHAGLVTVLWPGSVGLRGARRVKGDTLRALHKAGYLETKIIPPRGGRFPDGTTNPYAVSSLIYIPTDAAHAACGY